MSNIDRKTVDSFGDEWARYDQNRLESDEHAFLFETYFQIFPWELLPENAQGFDMGCGSGRWALGVAPRVGRLTCIDPAPAALAVARSKLSSFENVDFLLSGASEIPLERGSQDFGYSLGVLHHVPDTAAALHDCVSMLKPGAPFLVYLYYRFDNRPFWYSLIWRVSDILRRVIILLPPKMKAFVTDIIAALVYMPFAKISAMGQRFGMDVDGWVLSSYRDTSFYTMRTDARDRFGTPLEQRFTKSEIAQMMHLAGLEDLRFSERFPFWVAVGHKSDLQT